MNILLLHPPHTAIGSRIPRENLPPLGLLSIGGPLIDAGHCVNLLNVDPDNLPISDIVDAVVHKSPDAVLIGHSGSTSAHPTVVQIARRLKQALPEITIIYGGVYPTYHWKDVLEDCPEIDIIVRGEGEETVVQLMDALQKGASYSTIPGIALREIDSPKATRPASIIKNLDTHRIGWELIDFDEYSYWGGKKSVVVQFSRGCPHLCTYCGQRGFWTKWRHRDPVLLAKEIAWLHREHGVELINFADENPTSSRRLWKQFLEALIAEDVPVILIGSTRAGDIVRDADILHLYKKAGVLRFLLGVEAMSESTLVKIRKGSTPTTDQAAIRLMREHGMIGLCTFAVGFEEETDRDYLALMRQLLKYDPDQIMSVFATPHRWTPFFHVSKDRMVIQQDLRLWDYKHQVMETRNVPAWRVFLWVKVIELRLQARPKALWRTYFHPDPAIRHAMRWYTQMGRRVAVKETLDFFFRERRSNEQKVSQYLGGEKSFAEAAMRKTL
ncbi:magnesium-protoporphyrin IX monomethyl ester anaerobic oxidative cyclase [Roseovarius albus]|nr:magnesium-protoporphyrin IX monomethyl ester anaerobic oxidative cyclase [Roseovarius albus]